MCEVAPVSRYQSLPDSGGWRCYTVRALRAWTSAVWSHEAGGGLLVATADAS